MSLVCSILVVGPVRFVVESPAVQSVLLEETLINPALVRIIQHRAANKGPQMPLHDLRQRHSCVTFQEGNNLILRHFCTNKNFVF